MPRFERPHVHRGSVEAVSSVKGRRRCSTARMASRQMRHCIARGRGADGHVCEALQLEKLEEHKRQPCGAAYQGGARRYSGAESYASTVGALWTRSEQ